MELMVIENKLFSMKQTEENVKRIVGLEMKWTSLEVAVGVFMTIAK